ncbi:MAG: hypothetical protein EXR79_05230 [Myxococcales bacterium]|nr:hypothetical protein [Myxococcales bacterium]
MFSAFCGNGRTESAEQCDAGEKFGSAGCSLGCLTVGSCKSINFNGNGAYVQIAPAGKGLPFGTKLAVHGWFYLDALYGSGTCTGPGPAGACADLFSYGREGSYRVAARVVSGKVWAIAGNQAFELGPATTGQWFHVAVVVHKATLRGFLNGRKLAMGDLVGYPTLGTKADLATIGVSLDAANKPLHPFKGRAASVHATTATGGPFRRNFGPQVNWTPWVMDIFSLQLDDGTGTKPVDKSPNGHTVGAVATTWNDGSPGQATGPYCTVGQTLLPETKPMTPGFDSTLIPPGTYATIVRTSTYDFNHDLEPFYSWNDAGQTGYYLFGNSTDNLKLYQPGPDPTSPVGGKLVWKISYTEPKFPWGAGSSMMLKSECFDVKALAAPECWFAATEACTFPDFQPLISKQKKVVNGQTVFEDGPTSCGGGLPPCDFGQECKTYEEATLCSAKDLGTPGKANICGN